MYFNFVEEVKKKLSGMNIQNKINMGGRNKDKKKYKKNTTLENEIKKNRSFCQV